MYLLFNLNLHLKNFPEFVPHTVNDKNHMINCPRDISILIYTDDGAEPASKNDSV